MLFRDTQLRRVLLILLIALAGYFLVTLVWQALETFSSILLLFFAAWTICFILSPVTNWLQERSHMSRLFAVLCVYLALAVVLIGSITLAIPIIANQVGQVAARITVVASPVNLQHLNSNVVSRLKGFGIDDRDAHHLIDQFTGRLQSSLQSAATSVLSNSADLLSSAANILLDVVIALILSFYMMLDGRRLIERLIAMLPVTWRGNVNSVETHVGRVFGGFIRAQLFIGISYGILTWVALAVLGMANGLVISLVAGMIMLIPFAGPYLALIPPIALALLETNVNDSLRVVVILVIMLFVAQQIVLQVMAPRIMSQSIGLHPLWVFAALLIGAKEAGVWGAFFAAPIAALIAVLFQEIYARWAKTSPLFATTPALVVAPADAHEQLHDGNGLQPAPDDEAGISSGV